MRGRPQPLLLPNLGFCALFLYAMSVQFDDPDSIRWISIYAAAALATQLWGRAFFGTLFAALVGATAAIWAAALYASLPRWPSRAEIFTTRPMTGDEVEVTREALGLTIVAVWMSLLVILALRRRSRSRPNASALP